MLSKRNLGVLALLLMLFSCVYEPTDEYFKEIEKANTDDVTFELTDVTDTIYVYQTTHLGYSAVLGDHRLKIIRVWMGQTLVHYSEQPSTITIDPAHFESGTYKLRVEIETAGGTNSLADIMNKESVTININKQWVVIIDKEAPAAVHFTSIADNGHGQLELKWEAYKKFNFQSYELTKFCYDSFNQYYSWSWSQQIDHADATSMIDSSFVGGKVKYVISVKAANQQSASDSRELEMPYNLDVQSSWTSTSDIKVSWRKPNLHGSLGSYELTFYPDDDQRRLVVTNVNDTTITFDAKLKFPSWKIIRVEAKPKLAYGYLSSAYGQTDVILGKIFPFHRKYTLVYNAVLNKYFAAGYVNNESAVVSINPDTYEVEHSFPSQQGSFGISPNGQYFYVLSGYTLSRLDPNDFSVLDTYEVTSNYDPYYPWEMKVSNNNRMIAGSAIGSSVWDMNTFTRIQEFNSNYLATISPDGKFLFGYQNLFKFNGVDYSYDGSLDELGSRADFTNDNKLISYSYGTIRIFDLNTMSLVRSILSEASGYVSFDQKSGLIGGFSGDHGPKFYYIFSVNQNAAIKEFAIGNVDASETSMVLLNNQIICSCGNGVPLSHYE